MAAPDTTAAAVDVILAVGGGRWKEIRRILGQEGRYWVALRVGFGGKRSNEYNHGKEIYILIGIHVAALFRAKKVC